VLPDIYRLNSKQRDTLLDLYNDRLVESPVTVSRLSHHRVIASDRQGNVFTINPDGTWHRPPTAIGETDVRQR